MGKGQLMKFSYALIFTSLLFLSPPLVTRAQEAPPASQPMKLADLLAEAERSNPQIQAARHGWDSAKQVPTQASTLPDPQFVLQRSEEHTSELQSQSNLVCRLLLEK